MRALPYDSLAGAPPFVLGVAIVRGAPTPVVDAGLLLGQAPSSAGRFIALKQEGRTVALAVDEVMGVRSMEGLALSELPPLLSEAAHESVAAIGNLDSKLLLLLRQIVTVPESVFTSASAHKRDA